MRRVLALALLSALLLAAATPPVCVSGAEVLLLPGLALQFGVARAPRGALRASYLLGVVHVALFSWSLRHVIFAGYIGIVLVGGLYYVLAAAAVRAVRRPSVLAFGLAVAAVCWLRAEMPEIPYPHGQPCHALWRQPWLLGAVALGGEPLANGLLAAFAAALWQLGAAWRSGVPAFAAARRTAILVATLLAVLTALGLGAAPAGTPSIGTLSMGTPSTVTLVAIEPGVHPTDPFVGRDRTEQRRLWEEQFSTRLLEPTRRLAGEDASSPPDLVLWPESSVHEAVTFDATGRARFPGLRGLALAPGTRLCVGAGARRDPLQQPAPAAVLLGPDGRYLGHQEKRVRVPGGEVLPFLGLLPRSVADWMRAQVRAGIGYDPEVAPGQPQPLLATAAGVPFGALVCYDNAFPGPIAREVAAGARFLAVVSNEAWYRGGGELAQLAALTVVHAIACRVPIVRCTTDGLSLAVDDRGRVLAELPLRPAPQPAARFLRVDLPLGAGSLPPLAAWHPWLGATSAAGLLLLLLHGLWRRVRLQGLDRSLAGAALGGPGPDPHEGGS